VASYLLDKFGGLLPHLNDPLTPHPSLLYSGSLTVPAGEAGTAGSAGELIDKLESFFPMGKLDESLQPLDLSPINSWARKLGQVNPAAAPRNRMSSHGLPRQWIPRWSALHSVVGMGSFTRGQCRH
jgi:hypothetical protein